MMPQAELDLEATVAANLGGGMGRDHFGNRYHLVGHNYDLCEAEFDKLPDKEKALFSKIPPPQAEATPTPAPAPVGFHPGVQCDRSDMLPIVGPRFKLRGHNYDLCQAEFDKLPEGEKALYDTIPPPVTNAPNVANIASAFVNAAVGQGPWRPHGRCGWGRRRRRRRRRRRLGRRLGRRRQGRQGRLWWQGRPGRVRPEAGRALRVRRDSL